MAKDKTYTAVGRRKRSVAIVTLKDGKGNITANEIKINDYLPHETLVMDLIQPLKITEMYGKVDINIKVVGGGFNGQTGAIRLGITRALLEYNPEFRDVLKKAGMVTRDARIKERKKYGLKKARRAPQFSKR